MGKSVHMTRAGRRVFAKKTQPGRSALRHQFTLRGGGWL